MTRPTRPDAGRAPYALPPGTPALERPPAFGRRAFVLGALSTGLVGLVAGSRWLPATPLPTRTAAAAARTRLAWARSLATGELEDLLRGRETFLSVVARYGSREPELWFGWRRLAEATVSRESMPDRAVFAELLLQRLAEAPADVRAALATERHELEEIAR